MSKPEICVSGKFISTGRLIGGLLILLVMTAPLIQTYPLILAVSAMAALNLFKQWKNPPSIRLDHKMAVICLFGRSYRTRITNLVDVKLNALKLCLRFRDAASVDVEDSAKFSQNPSKTGYHLVADYGIFNLEQVNQLRAHLGFDPQSNDERGTAITVFERGLARSTPRAWVTPTLIAINCVLFVVLLLQPEPEHLGFLEQGRPFASIPIDVMLKWGANYGPASAAGEAWRLVTSVFLHWSIVHLFFNMWVLHDVGRFVERLLGNVSYLVTYLFSGVWGSIASVVFHHRPAVAAGASGAVFGLFGVLLGLLLRRRREFPLELLRQHRASCLGFLGFNLLLGFAISQSDMAAHIGGLAAGFVCGLTVVPTFSASRLKSPLERLAWQTAVALGVAGVGVAVLPLPVADVRMEVRRLFALETQVGMLFQSAMRPAVVQTEISPQHISETEGAIQRDVIDPWQATRNRLCSPTNVAPEDISSRHALVEFMRLREESWQLLASGILQRNGVTQGHGLEKLAAAVDVFQSWLKSDGERLGIPKWRYRYSNTDAVHAASGTELATARQGNPQRQARQYGPGHREMVRCRTDGHGRIKVCAN